jgi:hypothetical protein
MRLTAAEVGVVAARVGLASPLLAYRMTAGLERERWLREQRAAVYVEMIAAYGHNARYVSHPGEAYQSLSPPQWRTLQARIEAFTSDRVFGIRDGHLAAWDEYRAAEAAIAELAGRADSAVDPALVEQRDRLTHGRSAAAARVGDSYDELCRRVRDEMRITRRQWWRIR